MSMFSSRPAMRWLVPAAAAVAVIGGGAAIGTLAASAEPNLPPRSAAQLLVDVQTARLDGLSGTVVQRADLGLPTLPNLPGAPGGLSLASLVSGSHTLRVWYNGPDQARVALLDTLGETDLVRNGRDVWVWNSRDNTATHRRLPPDAKGKTLPDADDLPMSPQEAADHALAAIDPSTEVRVGRNAHVAGRTVYQLILAPRDRASLVDRVQIAIDSKEYLPLSFEVLAKGVQKPAFSVAFTQVSFERPGAEKFRFNPPAGAKVTEKSEPDTAGSPEETLPGKKALPEKMRPREVPGKPEHKPPAAPDKESSAVIGEGWTTVFATRVSSGAPEAEINKAAGENGGEGAAMALEFLGKLQPVSGPWGSGKLLSSRLFSALLTNDGRLLVGAVAPERLYQVAADPAAALK